MSSRQVKAIARYHFGIAKHLFIHIPKNGGLTIRDSRAMRRKVVFADPYFHISKAYTQKLAQTMATYGHHHGNQHARLIDIHPSVREHLQAVAIIRNPWARAFSRFTFRMRRVERQGNTPDFSPARFEEFLEERHEFGGREFYWHRAIRGWYPQADYVCDESGAVACDLLRLEDLDQELSWYFGVSKLASKNRSSSIAPKYTQVYTDRAIQIVGDWYEKDVDLFGFDFVGGATRNCVYSTEPDVS